MESNHWHSSSSFVRTIGIREDQITSHYFVIFLWSPADVILSRIKLHSSKQLSEIPSPFWTVRLGVTVTQSTRRALAHWLCRRTAWPWHPQVNGLQSKEARQERNEVQPAASWARPAGKIPISFNFRSTTWSKLLAGCPGNKMHCQCDPLKNICPSILAACIVQFSPLSYRDCNTIHMAKKSRASSSWKKKDCMIKLQVKTGDNCIMLWLLSTNSSVMGPPGVGKSTVCSWFGPLRCSQLTTLSRRS